MSISAQPRELGFYDTPGESYGVAVAGNFAYVAHWAAGLRVVDVSNPAQPREAGSYDTPGNAHGVAVGSNGLIYVADRTNLGIYDVSDALRGTSSSSVGNIARAASMRLARQ